MDGSTIEQMSLHVDPSSGILGPDDGRETPPSPTVGETDPSRAAAEPDEGPWLDRDERLTWLAVNALLVALPASLESQLGQDADLTYFEYTVLAALSEQPDGTLRMSQLALLANGSLSRMSHVARRLEKRGYLRRRPLPDDARIILAVLEPAGRAAVEAVAPTHARHVRTILFDRLEPGEREMLSRLALKLVDGIDPTMGAVARAVAEH